MGFFLWRDSRRQFDRVECFFSQVFIMARACNSACSRDPMTTLPFILDARRMNGDVPLLSLDPNADGVSCALVLHRLTLDPNQKAGKA